MGLITKLYLSITDSRFYHHVVSTRLRSAFFYSFGWYLLGSVVVGTVANTLFAPDAFQSFTNTLSHIQNQLPPNLVIHIDNYQLSTEGVATPFVISLPSPINASLTNVAVIDPQAAAEDITNHQALLLLTQNAVAINNPTLNTPQIIPWEQIITDTTQITAPEIIQTLQDIFQTVSRLYTLRWIITPAVLLLIVFPLRLITVLIDTILLNLTGNLLRRPLGYKNTLKVTLHTLVSTEIIVFLLGLIYTDLPSIVFPLAFFGLSLIALLTFPPVSRTA